jgi:hypothetical protein
MLNPYAVKRNNEYFRFITSGLIHQDYMHLFFNMFALYSFGNVVERHLAYEFPGAGQTLFAALYILGVVASDIPTYLKHQNQPYYNSLGASEAFLPLFLRHSALPDDGNGTDIYPHWPTRFHFWWFIHVLFVLPAQRGGDYINHDAHCTEHCSASSLPSLPFHLPFRLHPANCQLGRIF